MRRVVALMTVLGASAAWACGACYAAPELSLPDGAENVPTNLVIRVRTGTPTPAAYSLVRDRDGAQLTLSVTAGPGNLLWSIAPDALLEPRTRYTLNTEGWPVHFTTGDGEDHVAPEPPTLNEVRYHNAAGAPCGDFESWTLELTGGSDDSTPRAQLLVLLQTSNSDEPADARAVTTLAALTLDTQCGGFVPPAGTSFPAAVQVMDLAGNVSVLSAQKRAPACSASPAMTLVLLTLAMLRRRRD